MAPKACSSWGGLASVETCPTCCRAHRVAITEADIASAFAAHGAGKDLVTAFLKHAFSGRARTADYAKLVREKKFVWALKPLKALRVNCVHLCGHIFALRHLERWHDGDEGWQHFAESFLHLHPMMLQAILPCDAHRSALHARASDGDDAARLQYEALVAHHFAEVVAYAATKLREYAQAVEVDSLVHLVYSRVPGKPVPDQLLCPGWQEAAGRIQAFAEAMLRAGRALVGSAQPAEHVLSIIAVAANAQLADVCGDTAVVCDTPFIHSVLASQPPSDWAQYVASDLGGAPPAFHLGEAACVVRAAAIALESDIFIAAPDSGALWYFPRLAGAVKLRSTLRAHPSLTEPTELPLFWQSGFGRPAFRFVLGLDSLPCGLGRSIVLAYDEARGTLQAYAAASSATSDGAGPATSPATVPPAGFAAVHCFLATDRSKRPRSGAATLDGGAKRARGHVPATTMPASPQQGTPRRRRQAAVQQQLVEPPSRPVNCPHLPSMPKLATWQQDADGKWQFLPPRPTLLSMALRALINTDSTSDAGGASFDRAMADMQHMLGLTHPDVASDKLNTSPHSWRQRCKSILLARICAMQPDVVTTFPSYWNRSREALKDMIEYPHRYSDLRAGDPVASVGAVMTPAVFLRFVERLEAGQSGGKLDRVTYNNMKHMRAALSWLQELQHALITGEALPTPKTINQDRTIDDVLRERKASHNAEHRAARRDVGDLVPKVVTPEHLATMCEEFVGQRIVTMDDALAGFRSAFLTALSHRSFARGNTARSLMFCAMTVVLYPASDTTAIPESMAVWVNTTGVVKTSEGNEHHNVLTGRHRHPNMCALSYLVMYLLLLHCFAEEHVVAGPDGSSTTKRGVGPIPILEGKDAWYDWLLVNHGQPTQPISYASHRTTATVGQRAAGITGRQKTHHGRHCAPAHQRMKFSTATAELQQMGLWHLDTFQKCYGTLPSADSVAQNLDFTNRDAYYVPRCDLHPEMFGDRFAAMLEDSPFSWAHDIHATMKERNQTTTHRDQAGENVAFVYMCLFEPVFFQDLPYWIERHPDNPAWQLPFIKKWLQEGSLKDWCNLQRRYCHLMEKAREVFNQTNTREQAQLQLRMLRKAVLSGLEAGNFSVLDMDAAQWSCSHSSHALHALGNITARGVLSATLQWPPGVPSPSVVASDVQLLGGSLGVQQAATPAAVHRPPSAPAVDTQGQPANVVLQPQGPPQPGGLAALAATLLPPQAAASSSLGGLLHAGAGSWGGLLGGSLGVQQAATRVAAHRPPSAPAVDTQGQPANVVLQLQGPPDTATADALSPESRRLDRFFRPLVQTLGNLSSRLDRQDAKLQQQHVLHVEQSLAMHGALAHLQATQGVASSAVLSYIGSLQQPSATINCRAEAVAPRQSAPGITKAMAARRQCRAATMDFVSRANGSGHRPPAQLSTSLQHELQRHALQHEAAAEAVALPGVAGTSLTAAATPIAAAVPSVAAGAELRFLVVGKNGKATVTTARAPCTMPDTWLVPGMLHAEDAAPRHQQWLDMHSAHRQSLANHTLETLMEEWEQGVLLLDGTGRTAPLKVLEHPSLRLVWRRGGSMTTAMRRTKLLVYAVHRRMHSLPLNAAAAEVAGGIDHVQQGRKPVAEAIAAVRAAYPTESLTSLTKEGPLAKQEWGSLEYENWCTSVGINLLA